LWASVTDEVEVEETDDVVEEDEEEVSVDVVEAGDSLELGV
jgi:hypothetical protein